MGLGELLPRPGQSVAFFTQVANAGRRGRYLIAVCASFVCARLEHIAGMPWTPRRANRSLDERLFRSYKSCSE